jgi:hypothetical protein
MPNDENGTEVPEATPERTLEAIQDEMFEATSTNDYDRFDALEKELLLLDSQDTVVEEETEPTVEEQEPEVVPEQTEPVVEEEVVPEVTQPAPTGEAFAEMKARVEKAERLAREAELRALNTPTAPAPVSGEPTELVAPTAPIRPDIPVDPSLWEPEHITKYGEFQKAQEQFNQDTVKYMSSVGKNQQSLIENQKQQRLAETQQKQQRDAEKANESHWSGIRDLQKSIPSLGTAIDIADVHNSIDSFGDDLALLHGYGRGTTAAEGDAYNRAKNALVVKYGSGDQAILEKVKTAGLNKPDGFETYMSISEVNAFRSDMIESGVMGKNASFEDAYLLKSKRDGTLAESFNDVAIQEREQANVDIANKLKESQDTVRTPSSVAPASAQKSTLSTNSAVGGIEGLDSDDQAFFDEISKNPQYAFSTPENMEKMDKLSVKMANLGY